MSRAYNRFRRMRGLHMVRATGLLCTLLLAASDHAVAQPLEDFVGTWALEVEGRNLVVLTLTRGADGLRGTIERPGAISLMPVSRGIVISDVQGAVFSAVVRELRTELAGRVIGYDAPDGRLRTSLLQLDGESRLSFAFDAENPELATVTLVRAESSAAVVDDWDPEATYFVRNPPPAPNAEIAAIFAADQADRQGSSIDWSVVGPRDEARRARVRQMLDEGLLRAAQDYYYAAFVFQHGSSPEDYLVAHALAIAAQAAGHPGAASIAAATLDRFLQNIDRPQIFGTQYTAKEGEPITQGKYDSELIPDSLRLALGVPTFEQQETRRLEMEKRRRAP